MLRKKYSLLYGLITLSTAIVNADTKSQAKLLAVQAGSTHQVEQRESVAEFESSDPMVPGQPGHSGYISASYNYPAGIRAPNQCWDIYFSGAFLWWKVHQDNMFTASETNTTNMTDLNSGFEGTIPLNNEILTSGKPGYKPGFKIGVGWNMGSFDNWVLNAEYTGFHPSSGKENPDDGCSECGCPAELQLIPSCRCPGENIMATGLESNWKPRLDIIDLNVGRPAYQGKHLVLNPFFGLRALWIKQSWNVSYDAVVEQGESLVTGLYEKKADSKAWSLGPRIGVDGNWLLGAGFRIIGNASASLLYTRYTQLTYSSDIPNRDIIRPDALLIPVSWSYAKNYGTVRPNFEIDAGLAWGMYAGDVYRIDLAATYDFHTFFAQNMVSVIENEAVHYTDAAPGNLYIHGLTIKLRFDF